MTLYKKGTCDTSVVVSHTVYSCPECDYTEMGNDAVTASAKSCPKCGASLRIISSGAQVED